jgi:hypothetical protein
VDGNTAVAALSLAAAVLGEVDASCAQCGTIGQSLFSSNSSIVGIYVYDELISIFKHL